MLPRFVKNQQLRPNGVVIFSSGCRMESEDTKSDDALSTSSTMSMARVVEVCPACKKELQARAMFNHLRKIHPDHLKGMYCLYKEDKLDELIKANAPMPVEWRVMDDFDEEVDRILWGCLACNNTYTTEQTAQKHCNGKCKKDHNAQLKRIKKEEQQEKEQREKKIGKERLRWTNRTPQQIHSCIQQIITYYNKKWGTASPKIVQFMQKMIRVYNRTYDCDKYVFTPIPLPAFEDNKENMLKKEYQIGDDMENYYRLYKESLRLFWGDHTIVSDAEYVSLENNICWTNDYPDLKY